MFNWDDKNFYKLLLMNYHEEDFRSCDIGDYIGYKQKMRQIIAVENQIVEKNPDVIEDLSELDNLYESLNEVKEHYFFEEGVMFAFDMMTPEILAKKYTRMDKDVTEHLKRPICHNDGKKEDKEE